MTWVVLQVVEVASSLIHPRRRPGGMSTLAIGATIFILAQNYLQSLMGFASKSLEGIPLLPKLLHPDRWLLWLGVLFILSVYFFPTGIVGKLRRK